MLVPAEASAINRIAVKLNMNDLSESGQGSGSAPLQNGLEQQQAEPKPPSPSLTLSRLTFSDGLSIDLNVDDIVVFVGPNNAGKSAALKEIESQISSTKRPTSVIKGVQLRKIGTLEDLQNSLEKHSHKAYPNGTLHYTGSGYNISSGNVARGWNNQIELLRGFFCRRLKTESRIKDSDPSPTFNVLTEAASRPIQLSYYNTDIEDRLSGYFKAAFDLDLIVLRSGGSEILLLVGKRPALKEGEDPTRRSYLERLMKSATPLKDQGDGMRSFASVILEMLASEAPSMLLLDEPEAFLHPPQAKLLGEFLARERRPDTQMFIATHSPDVLVGLLNVAPNQLRVVRIQRTGNVNHIKELEKKKAKEIAADPLMKYSSVLSGVFHQRAIICESDADCLLYQAILSQKTVHDGPHPDVLFLHASGKNRMAKMAGALRALDVPVDIIADIDLLREKSDFKAVVEIMGGDWKAVEDDWHDLKQSIEKRKPWINADAVRAEILEVLGKYDGQAELPPAGDAEIRTILKKASPWGALKDAGDAAIPSGQPTQQMQKIRAYLEPLGIWVVRVGELEGFCKSIGGHGPKWVQKVIEERDLANDPELKPARSLVRSIWSRPLVSSHSAVAPAGKALES